MLSSKTRVLEREEAQGLPAIEEIGKESLVIRLGIYFSVTPSLLCLALVVENVCSVFEKEYSDPCQWHSKLN